MITIRNLHKSYGQLHVLDGIDLDFTPGKITAVLGPNGAGKTTLIKTLLGLVKPDEGTIHINGEKLNGNCEYRNNIGYMPQLARYPENLTVREIISMIRDIRNYEGSENSELIEKFNLKNEWEKAFKTLSGGNRQKVSAVLAFMFNPGILFLDEPTAGLDPISSSRLKDKIHQEREKGKTIILTSHILSEVQELAEEIIYLLDGKVYFRESMGTLIKRTGEKTLERAIATIIQGNAA